MNRTIGPLVVAMAVAAFGRDGWEPIRSVPESTRDTVVVNCRCADTILAQVRRMALDSITPGSATGLVVLGQAMRPLGSFHQALGAVGLVSSLAGATLLIASGSRDWTTYHTAGVSMLAIGATLFAVEISIGGRLRVAARALAP